MAGINSAANVAKKTASRISISIVNKAIVDQLEQTKSQFIAHNTELLNAARELATQPDKDDEMFRSSLKMVDDATRTLFNSIENDMLSTWNRLARSAVDMKKAATEFCQIHFTRHFVRVERLRDMLIRYFEIQFEEMARRPVEDEELVSTWSSMEFTASYFASPWDTLPNIDEIKKPIQTVLNDLKSRLEKTFVCINIIAPSGLIKAIQQKFIERIMPLYTSTTEVTTETFNSNRLQQVQNWFDYVISSIAQHYSYVEVEFELNGK